MSVGISETFPVVANHTNYKNIFLNYYNTTKKISMLLFAKSFISLHKI